MKEVFSQQNMVIAQTILLCLSIVFILMQNRGAGLSSAFGGRDEVYLTRRGIEKWVINLTVVCIVLFVIIRIFALYL